MRTAADELRILSRRTKVAELVLKGVTNQFEICRQLGMDEKQNSTICRDIAALNKEWRDRINVTIDEHKARELAKLDLVESAAWKGWDRSLLDAETREAVKSGDRETAKRVSKGQAGDPSFLRIILDCISQRRSLCGLDDAKKLEHTVIGSQTILQVTVIEENRRDAGTPAGADGQAPPGTTPLLPEPGSL